MLAIQLLWLGNLPAQQTADGTKKTPLNHVAGWRQPTYDDFLAEQKWPTQHPMLLNLISQIQHVSQSNLELYAQETREVISEEGNILQPEMWLGHVFEIAGQVHKVSKLNLDEKTAEQFAIDHFFIARINQGNHEFRVVVEDVPEVWKFAKDELNEPVRLFGYLLKAYSDGYPLFVSKSLQWLPVTENAELNIKADQVLLAGQGVDLGLREKIDNASTVPINHDEAQLLLQILKSIKKMNLEDCAPPKNMNLVKWLKNPEKSFGDRYHLEGRVKKISIVEVDNPLLRSRYGVDRYYQIDLYVASPEIDILDEKGQPVTDEDGNAFKYNNRYAVSVISRELPAIVDMKGQLSIETEFVASIDAFFFKNWKQQNFRTRAVSANLTKSTPLLIAYNILPKDSPGSWVFPFMLIAIAIGILFGFFLLFSWRSARHDAKSRKRQEKNLPEIIDVDF